jgi:hypothetical protein
MRYLVIGFRTALAPDGQRARFLTSARLELLLRRRRLAAMLVPKERRRVQREQRSVTRLATTV